MGRFDRVYATGEPFTGREWRIEVAGHVDGDDRFVDLDAVAPGRHGESCALSVLSATSYSPALSASSETTSLKCAASGSEEMSRSGCLESGCFCSSSRAVFLLPSYSFFGMLIPFKKCCALTQQGEPMLL